MILVPILIVHLYQIVQRPRFVNDSSGHGWRGFQRDVFADEVVVEEMQAKRGTVVLEFLREGVRLAREATAVHANREVLTLYKRRADFAKIGIADQRHFVCADNDIMASFILGVAFHELPKHEVRLGVERKRHRVTINRKPVRSDLDSATSHAAREIMAE